MLEASVENYLCEQVRKIGGEVRKVRWEGRRHAPDRRVMHPALCCYVELKAPGQKPRPGQLREHARMRALGEDVRVIDTLEGVDVLIREMVA